MQEELNNYLIPDLSKIVEGYTEIDYKYLYQIAEEMEGRHIPYEFNEYIEAKLSPNDRKLVKSTKATELGEAEYKYLFDVVYESNEIREGFDTDIWYYLEINIGFELLSKWVMEKLAPSGWYNVHDGCRGFDGISERCDCKKYKLYTYDFSVYGIGLNSRDIRKLN